MPVSFALKMSFVLFFKDGQTAVSIATNKNRKDILVALYAKMKERKGHHPVREMLLHLCVLTTPIFHIIANVHMSVSGDFLGVKQQQTSYTEQLGIE